jgi:hypothetical protein
MPFGSETAAIPHSSLFSSIKARLLEIGCDGIKAFFLSGKKPWEKRARWRRAFFFF